MDGTYTTNQLLWPITSALMDISTFHLCQVAQEMIRTAFKIEHLHKTIIISLKKNENVR